MHEQPRGFPGFKASPAAFLMDAIQNHRMPPDWIYAHEKQRKQEQWAQERAAFAAEEETLRLRYDEERAAALQAYLTTSEGMGGIRRSILRSWISIGLSNQTASAMPPVMLLTAR